VRRIEKLQENMYSWYTKTNADREMKNVVISVYCIQYNYHYQGAG